MQGLKLSGASGDEFRAFTRAENCVFSAKAGPQGSAPPLGSRRRTPIAPGTGIQIVIGRPEVGRFWGESGAFTGLELCGFAVAKLAPRRVRHPRARGGALKLRLVLDLKQSGVSGDVCGALTKLENCVHSIKTGPQASAPPQGSGRRTQIAPGAGIEIVGRFWG